MKFKAGDIVICNTTIFNLKKGQEYEVVRNTYFDGVLLRNFDNLSGGYGECWFDRKPTESELFAESLLNEMTENIIAFEQLENELKKTNK